MKRILIYDDIPAHSAELERLLRSQIAESAAEIDIAAEYSHAKELLRQHAYAMIFLDIELDEGHSGIEFGEFIRKKHPEASLVYITSYIKYCEEIFRASPDAFMVKPFSAERLKRTLDIIRQKNSSSGHISISASKNVIETIALDDIAYIESAARYLTFCSNDFNSIYEFYGIKLSDIASRLPDNFVHCHQSLCVNMRKVRRLERYCFVMENGRELPVSQSRFTETRQRYLDFLEGTL